jgi:uncharacterized protein (DUF1330 family)
MSAYLIAQIHWHDQEKAKEYREKLGPTPEKHGARTLYAGEPRVLEGEWDPLRTVLIEFPNMEALRAWYDSEEYAPLIHLRKQAGTTNMVAVEQLAG